MRDGGLWGEFFVAMGVFYGALGMVMNSALLGTVAVCCLVGGVLLAAEA